MGKIFVLAFLCVILFSCQNRTVSPELEKTMNTLAVETSNKTVVTRMFEAIDKTDTIKVRELVSKDFKLIAPGNIEPFNCTALIQAMVLHYSAFPNWKHDVEYLVATEDKVIAKVLQKGIQTADYQGIPPSNKVVQVWAMYEFTVMEGKINKLWVIEDNLGLYMQLGMELKPKESEV